MPIGQWEHGNKESRPRIFNHCVYFSFKMKVSLTIHTEL
uniref:Uncharacterized protein n=1 Tax=Anguilla anguilla TaxID=7936 RepID=A0A0E9PXN6_ANGAN